MIIHVENQILAHYREFNQSEIADWVWDYRLLRLLQDPHSTHAFSGQHRLHFLFIYRLRPAPITPAFISKFPLALDELAV
jgi:hypothetical protein